MFTRDGNLFFPIDTADQVKTLPVGTYSVKADPMRGYYLELTENFKVPARIYGNSAKFVERILNTFADRPGSTGVLLEGEKGSGKTLVSKLVSLKANMPTLIVNTPFHGEAFNMFLRGIKQPAVMLFDEFEKVYRDKQHQEALLTLLDGIHTSKKLFIFTCNNQWLLDDNLRNRPSRIFYSRSYKGLDENFIREYCEDKLENKEHIGNIVKAAEMVGDFNFDMLQSLVEELNRYDETVLEALDYLNIKTNAGANKTYAMKFWVDNEEKMLTNGYEIFNGNPLKTPVIEVHDGKKYHNFKYEHLQNARPGRMFVYKFGKKKLVLTLKRNEEPGFSHYAGEFIANPEE